MAARFVLGPAWSLAFLVASTFPLLFPDNTPDDQTIASILFFMAFISLLLPAVRISSAMPDGDGMLMLKWIWFGDGSKNLTKSVGLSVLGVVAFISHIVVDVRIGWISYALFLTLWFHLTWRIGTALIPASGRWLLPLGESYDGSKIPDTWVIESKKFRGGRLAFKDLSGGRKLELYGVNRSGDKFVAFHLRHPSSILFDPFVMVNEISSMSRGGLGYCGPRVEGLDSDLQQPPITIAASDWSARFFRPTEEE
jgi:hypothetical protein